MRRLLIRALDAVGLERVVRRRVVQPIRETRALANPYRSPEQELWTKLKEEVRAVATGRGPIVVGPWLSEVGFEVLYWLPFLRFVIKRFEIDPARITVVSRGGVSSWYGGLCGRYVEIFDFMTPAEFREHTEARWRDTGGQKQMEFGKWDRAVLRAAGDRVDWSRGGVLHPSLMYRFFRDFFKGASPISHVVDHALYDRWSKPEDPDVVAELPDEDYVAVKFYFRPSFPDTAANRRVVSDMVEALATRSRVVILNTGLEVDEHLDVDPGIRGERVRWLLDDVPPTRNLHVQSVAISRASAFLGTYGGLSYVAPAYGVRSIALFSERQHFLPSHLDLARRAATSAGASIMALDVAQLDLVQSAAARGRAPVHV